MRIALIALLCTGLIACDKQTVKADCDLLEVSQAWIRQAPPGAPVMAGYLMLKNANETALTIRSASTEAFERVEFHETVTDNGQVTMKKRESLELAAGDNMTLAPGGMHLMLFTPKSELTAGKSVDISFTCENGQQKTAAFDVKKMQSVHDDAHHGHHGHH